jgi:RNA polymerase sigma-70 factor (ECF subfamily)
MTVPSATTVPEEAARDFDALFQNYYTRLARLLYRVRERYESLESFFGMAESPERVAEQNQDRTRVRQVLAFLKPDQAGLILMRAEGFSYSEIATALGLNPASVGTRLARAEQAFRKEFVKRYGDR